MKAPVIVCLTFCFSSGLHAGNWPAWRGPDGNGVSTEKNLPLRWSPTNQIRWSTPLPERGNSTPIVWGSRVFVTQALGQNRTVMCLDRADGKVLWQSGTNHAEKELTHGTNPLGSSSPVTDGECVISAFGSAGILCHDFQGKLLWRRDLGKQVHIWGYGAAPVLHGDLCILNFGPGERSFLIALNKKTGATVWQVDEPGGHSGQTKPGDSGDQWIGSWSTPLLIQTGGHDELIQSWPRRVAALDPKTGKELWTCRGLNPLVYTSPLFAEGVIVAMGGYNGDALAVKSGGSGDVTGSHRLWLKPKTKQRIGSGVISEGHIYILNDPGVAECIELTTGKVLWEERLAGPGPKNSSWSSMVLAEGKLYVINQGGDTFVVKASPKFELLGVNPLGETSNSSLAVSDGELFIRTHKSLWCVGVPPK